MKLAKILIAGFGIAAASALATPALAGDVYIVGSAGTTSSSHSIERNLGENPPTLPVPDAGGTSTSNDEGIGFTLGAGYKTSIGDGPIYVGVEGFYGIENVSSRNINGVLVTDLDINSQYGGKLILGRQITDEFSVYSHAGLSVIEFDLGNSYTFAPPVRSRSNRETALAFGAGASFKMSESIEIFGEYTRVSEIEFGGIPEVAGGTGRVNPNDLNLDRVSVGFRWSL